jgi:hypothetical protein
MMWGGTIGLCLLPLLGKRRATQTDGPSYAASFSVRSTSLPSCINEARSVGF